MGICIKQGTQTKPSNDMSVMIKAVEQSFKRLLPPILIVVRPLGVPSLISKPFFFPSRFFVTYYLSARLLV